MDSNDVNNINNNVGDVQEPLVPVENSELVPIIDVTGDDTNATGVQSSQSMDQVVDALMQDIEDEDMPPLQEISDSDDSDDDRDADEVEMQTVDGAESQSTPPMSQLPSSFSLYSLPSLASVSSLSSSGAGPPRPNRRARVEDDDDDERDRRHPSQRTSTAQAGPSNSIPTTAQPAPHAHVPTPPPAHAHAHHHHHGPFDIFGAGFNQAQLLNGLQAMLPAFMGTANAPANNQNNNANNDTPETNEGEHTDDDTPPPLIPTMEGFAISISMGEDGQTHVHRRPLNARDRGAGNPLVIPSNTFTAQAIPQGQAAAGPPEAGTGPAAGGPVPASGAGGAGGFGLPPLNFRLPNLAPFLMGLGDFAEREDPERAKKLVEGLEDVPVGLVRRLERVGRGGGGMGEDETRGGDGGCAICWDQLLPAVNGVEGQEIKDEEETKAETSVSDEQATVSSDSIQDRDVKTDPEYPRVVTLPCAHVFHADCLIPWFSRPRHTTCPTCRFNIDPENLTYVSSMRRRREQQEREAAARRQAGEEQTPPGEGAANAQATPEATVEGPNPAQPGTAPVGDAPHPAPTPAGPTANPPPPGPHVHTHTHTHAHAFPPGLFFGGDGMNGFMGMGMFVGGPGPAPRPQSQAPGTVPAPTAEGTTTAPTTATPASAEAGSSTPSQAQGPADNQGNRPTNPQAGRTPLFETGLLGSFRIPIPMPTGGAANAQGGAEAQAQSFSDLLTQSLMSAMNTAINATPTAGTHTFPAYAPPSGPAASAPPAGAPVPPVTPGSNDNPPTSSSSTANQRGPRPTPPIAAPWQVPIPTPSTAQPSNAQPQGSQPANGRRPHRLSDLRVTIDVVFDGGPFPGEGDNFDAPMHEPALGQPPALHPMFAGGPPSEDDMPDLIPALDPEEEADMLTEEEFEAENQQMMQLMEMLQNNAENAFQQGRAAAGAPGGVGANANPLPPLAVPREPRAALPGHFGTPGAGVGGIGISNFGVLPGFNFPPRQAGQNPPTQGAQQPGAPNAPPMATAPQNPGAPPLPADFRWILDPPMVFGMGQRPAGGTNRPQVPGDAPQPPNGAQTPGQRPPRPTTWGAPLNFSLADFMRPAGPEPPKRPWAPPAAPGLTLRQRVERRERESGLRCDDVSCGLGPSDEDPLTEDLAETVKNMQQLSIQSKGKGEGGHRKLLCEHKFHSSCLVSAARVAMGDADAVVDEHGCVEVSCPVCRHDGCLAQAEWDNGVNAL